MAWEHNLKPIPLPSSGNLSTNQYYFVDVDSNGNAVVCSAIGQRAAGVLQDAPTVLGQEVAIAVAGQVSKVVAGAAIAVGASVMSDASGRAITFVNATGNYCQGIALDAAAASGVNIPVLLLTDVSAGQSSNVSSYKLRVPLTAAQIIALHASPVSLVPAPPAGQTLVFEWMTFQLTFGTTQFTGGGVVMPVYHGATTDLSVVGGIAAATVQGAASFNYLVRVVPAAGGLALTSATGIDLYAATANFAAGDSTAVVEIAYSVITLG